jgi:hypothetical protein
MVATVTLQIPDQMHQRLIHHAEATQQTLEQVILRVLEIGSPPTWEDVPIPFQGKLAALDRLSDQELWNLTQAVRTEAEMVRYDALLDRNADGCLTEAERQELNQLRSEAEYFTLQKAHAAILLRWRGHPVPKLQVA